MACSLYIDHFPLRDLHRAFELPKYAIFPQTVIRVENGCAKRREIHATNGKSSDPTTDMPLELDSTPINPIEAVPAEKRRRRSQADEMSDLAALAMDSTH